MVYFLKNLWLILMIFAGVLGFWTFPRMLLDIFFGKLLRDTVFSLGIIVTLLVGSFFSVRAYNPQFLLSWSIVVGATIIVLFVLSALKIKRRKELARARQEYELLKNKDS